MATTENLMDKIISLAKRRGFVFPGSEIYGGLANSWDYGPYGAQLKKNIKDHWWRFFVESRDDMVGLDAAIIMNPKVWEASGHIGNFSDPLIECKECHERYRADHVIAELQQKGEDVYFVAPGATSPMSFGNTAFGAVQQTRYNDFSKYECPKCKKVGQFSEPRAFNGLMKTSLGPIDDASGVAYLRPETAQAMFVDFAMIQQASRKKLPFGVAQIGKAFRNEITPGNFIFRTREFEQMEIEYFFDEKKSDWQALFDGLKSDMEAWMEAVGIKGAIPVEIPDGERAHYSKRTIDFEFEYPFGQKELFGLAYRGDYDMKQHEDVSGQELKYLDPETNEKVRPHVIEPSLGVDRAMLAILLSGFEEQKLEGDDVRTVLHLKPAIAPVQVAVFPLMKNKPELVEKAREVYQLLKQDFRAEFDDNGNVGKRYRRQDEIGTPYCVTIDFDTLGAGDDKSLAGTVTVRDRDTMQQERVKIEELPTYLKNR